MGVGTASVAIVSVVVIGATVTVVTAVIELSLIAHVSTVSGTETTLVTHVAAVGGAETTLIAQVAAVGGAKAALVTQITTVGGASTEFAIVALISVITLIPIVVVTIIDRVIIHRTAGSIASGGSVVAITGIITVAWTDTGAGVGTSSTTAKDSTQT